MSGSMQKSRASAHMFAEMPLNMSALVGSQSTIVYECRKCEFSALSVAEAQGLFLVLII